MITIVDYGMGNLHSVANALRTLKADAEITRDPEAIAKAERLILPGVGAFGAAMRELASRGLAEPIRAHVKARKPYLGICLGLQVLFESSEESPDTPGLGIFKGAVRRFAERPGLKIPHMGWNRVDRPRSADGARPQACALADGIPDGSFLYFVHSYFADPEDRSLTVLETEYGARFTAMIARPPVYATQFHPEKSQSLGLAFLRRFAEGS